MEQRGGAWRWKRSWGAPCSRKKLDQAQAPEELGIVSQSCSNPVPKLNGGRLRDEHALYCNPARPYGLFGSMDSLTTQTLDPLSSQRSYAYRK